MPWDSELEVGGSQAGCACVGGGGVSKQQAASPTWNHFSVLCSGKLSVVSLEWSYGFGWKTVSLGPAWPLAEPRSHLSSPLA